MSGNVAKNSQFNTMVARIAEATEGQRLPKTADTNTYPVGSKGSIVYNTTDDTIYKSDGLVWSPISGGGGGGETWAETLVLGNTSGGTDPTISAFDAVIFEQTAGAGGGRIENDFSGDERLNVIGNTGADMRDLRAPTKYISVDQAGARVFHDQLAMGQGVIPTPISAPIETRRNLPNFNAITVNSPYFILTWTPVISFGQTQTVQINNTYVDSTDTLIMVSSRNGEGDLSYDVQDLTVGSGSFELNITNVGESDASPACSVLIIQAF